MKGGTQAALALGVGYVLGRRRKMRMTTVLAAAAATGSVGGLGGAAIRRGAKMLGSTEMLGKVAPQLGEIAGTVRGDLLDAGKAAAVAAVSNRIESLTDSLHERAEIIRDPSAGAGDAARGLRRRDRSSRDDEHAGAAADDDRAGTEGDLEEDEPIEDEASADEPEDDEQDAEPDDDEQQAAPRRRDGRGRSPVARARR